jgi:hypothetical protein
MKTNGKGDKLRKGANLVSFRTNYDEISWAKKENISILSDKPSSEETNSYKKEFANPPKTKNN